MIPFKAGERERLDGTLIGAHTVRVKVYVTDLEGKSIADVSGNLLGGQVDVDVEAEVSRVLNMTLLDPKGEIALDSNDPSQSAMYMDNMIQVVYGVQSPSMTAPIDVPIFTGPIIGLKRNNDEIELVAYGKEHLGQAVFWQNFNAKKGANKVETIKRIMSDGAGEDSFLLPEFPNSRLAADLSVLALKQSPWEAAQKIAESMNRALYYDGAGRLRLRSKSGNNIFTFQGGDEGMLMSVPSVSFSTENAKNAVVVKGKTTLKPKKKGDATVVKSFSARAVVDKNHPLSPWQLGRNGVPRYLVEEIENDKINTTTEAKNIAETELMRLVEQQTEIAFDSLPVPYLEEWDRVKIIHEDFTSAFTLTKFSIPLTVGDVMTVGYNRRLLTIKRTNIKTKKTKRVTSSTSMKAKRKK